MGRPARINHAVHQRKGAALLVGPRIECDRVSSVPGSRGRGRDGLGAAEFLRSGGDIQGMQGLGEGGDGAGDRLGHGHEINGSSRGIDDGRVRNADLGGDLGAIDISLSHGRGDTPDEAVMPIGHPGVVGVESVCAVVLGDHVNDVVGSAADGDAGHIKGLGVNLAINRVGEKLPERGAVDVGGGEEGLVLVPAVPGLVVMVGRQGGLGPCAGRSERKGNDGTRKR